MSEPNHSNVCPQYGREHAAKNYTLPTVLLIYSIICTIIPISFHTQEIEKAYTALVVSSWIYTILIFLVYNNRRLDIFEPYVLIALLHIMIFLVSPVRSIWIDDLEHRAGAYTFGGAIKGTIIALISFTIFTILYEICYPRVIAAKETETDENTDKTEINPSRAVIFSLVIWTIGFVSAIIFLSLRGMSLTYVLSLGQNGDFNDDLTTNSAYSFLSVVSNLAFGSWLIYYRYGKNRLLVWLLFFATIATLVVRGYRIYILIFIVSPAIYRYLILKTRPKVRSMVYC